MPKSLKELQARLDRYHYRIKRNAKSHLAHSQFLKERRSHKRRAYTLGGPRPSAHQLKIPARFAPRRRPALHCLKEKK